MASIALTKGLHKGLGGVTSPTMEPLLELVKNQDDLAAPGCDGPLPDQGQSGGQIDGGGNRGEAEAQAGQDAIGSDRDRSIE